MSPKRTALDAVEPVLADARIAQFLEQYREPTRSAYRTALGRFFVHAGFASVDQALAATPAQVAPVLRVMERRYKPSTVTQTLVATRRWYEAVRLESPDVVDPTAGQKHRAVRYETEWNVLHQGDAERLLELVEEPRDRAVLLALILQGWRASELAAMTWGQVRSELVDGEETWFVEWRSKRAKYRRQGLQPLVLEAARAVSPRQQPADPFIPYAEGEPLSRFQVYYIVRRYAARLGLKVTPHGLRATYTSSVIARKGIEAARQIVGHSDIKTTQRYSRWRIDRDDALTLKDF